MNNREIAEKLIELLEQRDEQTSVVQNGRLMDISAPEAVQITLSDKVVWVSVDGVCVLRCSRFKALEVDDMRGTKDESST
jgi:hypothetical protein